MMTLISKRIFQYLAAPLSALLLGMGLMISAPASAQDDTTIVGSVHDFSGQTTWTQNANAELCIVCHTPHNALSPDDGPLWNRTLTAATFTTYEVNAANRPGSDLDGTGFGQPTGVSKLCLSCHDGSIAIDSFGRAGDGTPFTAGTEFIDSFGPNRNIGEVTAGTGNLSNDHPVAFTFPTAVADPEIVQPVSGFVATILPLFGASNDQME
ncbi:MAG: hypothetical protein OEM63_11240, partial [Gammaproteobacteria bacterium]|nr:hypothetical protein [Gammaproteobacteria bacterium]